MKSRLHGVPIKNANQYNVVRLSWCGYNLSVT